ncbi:MAG: spherulation-specific family 4 protein [Methylococcaceae bacterium]|nr:spherulation-specific family 4 protein [Methylococcaceae bacterium]
MSIVMKSIGRTGKFGSLPALVLTISSFCGGQEAQATPIEILVPAYANPCCGDGLSLWGNLIHSAQTAGVKIDAILNPASGPGSESFIDPNYVSSTGNGPVVDLRKAGGTVYGYVHTREPDGKGGLQLRPVGDVKTEVDKYYDTAYWRGASVQIDGIFFDEMSNKLADVGYYQQLHDYVRSKSASAKVIGNPGTTFIDNSGNTAGYTVQGYASVADTLVTFENTGDQYRNHYTPPSWLNDFSSDHFANLVHGEASSSNMLLDVNLAKSRKTGMVYITDDTLPNPWDTLSAYWPAEIRALTIVEPATLVMTVLGLTIMAVGRRQTNSGNLES